MMWNILCFGDSNTFGYDTVNDSRFPWGIRWTSLVQEKLGEEYRIIEEGMGGRTTVWDDPVECLQSGKNALYSCLESHWPLDVMVIMLGTNDLKTRFGLGAYDIASGVETLVQMSRDFFRKKGIKVPAILIISPIEVDERIAELPYGIVMGGKTAAERSKEFPKYYRDIAERNGCWFMAASEYAAPCKEDCMHLDETGHRKLADAVTEKIEEIRKSLDLQYERRG